MFLIQQNSNVHSQMNPTSNFSYKIITSMCCLQHNNAHIHYYHLLYEMISQLLKKSISTIEHIQQEFLHMSKELHVSALLQWNSR